VANQDEKRASVRAPRYPAFQSRAFRELWAAQTISVMGSQMQMSTVRWHVYEIWSSPVALALLSFSRFVPIVIFSLVGGAVADARDRRRVLLTTQAILTVGATFLFWLTESGRVTAGAIYAINAMSASAVAFDNPARQSLTPNLVPREHYPNAASLNSISMNAATVLGPLIGGFFIAIGHLEIVYAVNAISFLAVILALVRMRDVAAQLPAEERPRVNRQALKEGLLFVWRTPILVWTIVLDSLATFFSSADALLPMFARDVLHVKAGGYGLLVASEAIGSLTAGAIMASFRQIKRQGRTILISVAVYGLATVVFGASHWFWLSCLALAVAGAADTISTVIRQTIRQLVTPDHLRGRMSATMMLFFMGGPQLGNVEAGLVAKWVGAPLSVITGGIGCLIAVAWVAAKGKELRGYEMQTDDG
jgi:MFS family permease